MSFTYHEIKNIQTTIEDLPICYQKGILKILVENKTKDYDIQDTEKKGCFIKLNNVPDAVLEKIQDYLVYVQTQEQELNKMEMEKDNLKQMLSL